jgi:hypothetical protein
LSTAKLAALNEITLFGLDEDIKLVDVFERMKSASSVPDAKADGKKLREFFREVAPDHDEEKVYASDMKKVLAWYQVLKDMPLFNEVEPALSSAEETPVIEEAAKSPDTKTAAKPQAKAKKASAKKTE